MRFARHFLLATLAFGAAACSDEDLGPTRAAVPPLAYVRYINATPDTLSHTVRWTDDIEFTPMTYVNVGFRTEGQGAWQGLRAGTRDFSVFTYQQNTNNFPVAGNTTVLADTSFNFVAGSYYTILFTGFTRTGSTPAAELRIIQDDPPASPAAGTLLRVYNVAYGLDFDLYMSTLRVDATDTTIAPPDTTITTDTTYAITPDNAGVDTTITVDTVVTVDTTITSKDANPGMVYTAAQLGTLIASGSSANVGTVVGAYAARPTGAFGARLTATAATTTSIGVKSLPALGLAETADFEAAGGVNITGSVITAWVFNGKPAGTPGAASSNARPMVLFTVDRSPARTIAP